MKNRILSLLLCVCMLAGVLTGVTLTAAADGELTFTAETLEDVAAPGDVIEVNIDMSNNNSGVTGIKLKVAYDSDLEFDITELLEEDEEYTVYGSKFLTKANVVEPTNGSNPIVLTWARGTSNLTTKNTTFATLTFKVKEGATSGFKAITVYSEAATDIARLNGTATETLAATFVSGGVTVEGAEPACEHVPAEAVQENVVPATCGADGSYDSVVYCSLCSEELSRTHETIPATGEHTPAAAVQENVVPATCVTAGSYDSVVYCSLCNAELSRTPGTIPATGVHTWNAGEITTPATATADGVKTYTCTVCGETKTEPIPMIQLTFTAETLEDVAEPGDVIEVNIDMSNNETGVTGIKLKVAYSSDLEFDITELLEEDEEYSVYGSKFLTKATVVEPTNGSNPIVLTWARGTSNLTTKNTTFATLTFKVKEGATNGFKAITVYSEAETDIAKLNGTAVETLPATFVNGGVTVTGGTELTTPLDILKDDLIKGPAAASLTEDITTSEILNVKSGVTLDLNGHTLTCGGLSSTQPVKVVDSSAANDGLLKVSKTGVTFATDNGNYLPAWDDAAVGYRLLYTEINTVEPESDKKPALAEGQIRAWFKPTFKNDVLAKSVLMNGCNSTGVAAEVEIKNMNTEYYKYEEHTDQPDVLNYWNTFCNAANGWFYLTIGRIAESGVEKLDITPLLRFGTNTVLRAETWKWTSES